MSEFDEAIKKCLRPLPGKERKIKRCHYQPERIYWYWCKGCHKLLDEDIVPIGKKIPDGAGFYTYLCEKCARKEK